MFEDALSAAIRVIRGYTAVRAWAVEVLAVFVVLTVGRFGLAVWMFDTAASGAGAGSVPGWVPAAAAVGLVAGEAGLGAGGAPWWVAWLYAYDNLRSYAENAIILGVIFAFAFEGGFMFLARKRIRLSKEEVRAELQPRLDAAEATAAQYQATIVEATTAAAQATAAVAQATAQMEAMQKENRLLREGQALRDEENRLLRERVAQLENGGGNGNAG